MWCHHRNCYIIEVTLLLISFESQYYQNEIWWNSSNEQGEIDFMNKNENNCSFCAIAYFVYYKCFYA